MESVELCSAGGQFSKCTLCKSKDRPVMILALQPMLNHLGCQKHVKVCIDAKLEEIVNIKGFDRLLYVVSGKALVRQ